MILCDVSVLVYAFRADVHRHPEYRAWLLRRLESDESYGVSDLVFSGFLRLLTHPRVFNQPSPFAEAIEFVEVVRSRPSAAALAPGARHWEVFRRLCERSGAKGNLIPDAYLAALAIESGCEWITTDRDYSRFEGLRWHHPLE